MINTLATLIATLLITLNPGPAKPASEKVLAERQFSLENRYPVKNVNEVMKKNILLNLAYLNRTVSQKGEIDWEQIEKPFHFEFILEPEKTFAYHEKVLPEFTGKVALTTNARFNAADGFLSDGYLFGDGVCHIASLINWAALDAGLKTIVPKDHRGVGPIPNVPDQYGVSIYLNTVTGAGANNNLYITNTRDHQVKFHFDYNGADIKVYVTELG